MKTLKTSSLGADRPLRESSHLGLGHASNLPPADIYTDVLGRRFWAAMVDGLIPVRTLGRIVDGLPVFFIVGFISLISGQAPRKRVGDRMARTTVARV